MPWGASFRGRWWGEQSPWHCSFGSPLDNPLQEFLLLLDLASLGWGVEGGRRVPPCSWALPLETASETPALPASCTPSPDSVLSPEPPAIAPGPSNLTLTAHSPASLPCEASGSPKPLVVWWKDGQKLDFRLQQGAYRY